MCLPRHQRPGSKGTTSGKTGAGTADSSPDGPSTVRSEDRIALDAFPQDWKYYTLTFPTAKYKHLSIDAVIEEMTSCNRQFYSLPRILRRVCHSVWHRRRPLISLVANLSYRSNFRLDRKAYADFMREYSRRQGP